MLLRAALVCSILALSVAFCPDFLASEKSCNCYSYVDGAVINCDGPDGPAVVEKLKTSNTEIRQLSITNADIIEIGPKAFRNLRIKSLVLDHNRVRTIHPDAFRGLEFTLLHLSLGHNKLTEVPTDSLIGMSNLQTLDISCNNIGDLLGGPVFRNATSIIELNLSCNQICKISRDAFEGVKDSLQSLILDQNCLHEVPAEALRGFKNMLGLHLQHNQIESLDKLQFMNLLSLLMVRLSGNQIRTVDKQAFNNIPNLRYLFLDRNKLTSIEPNTLQQFKFLEIVDLSFNDIGEIPTGAFSQMDHLMQLNLEGNTITDISPGAFSGSPLLLLLLGQNCLASVTQQTFQGISFLRQLSLTNNNLRLIQPFAFASLPSLQLLDLTGNHIESLQPASFTFSQQATVLVQENPVVCSQGFHIIQGGQGIHLLNQPNLICSAPNSDNATCPSKRNIPTPPTCCSAKVVNTTAQKSPVEQPNLARFIKGPIKPETSTTVATTTVKPTTSTTTPTPTTTIAAVRLSSTSSPVTKPLNLERFWRLTAAPNTVKLNRLDQQLQQQRNQPARVQFNSSRFAFLTAANAVRNVTVPVVTTTTEAPQIDQNIFNNQNQFGQQQQFPFPQPTNGDFNQSPFNPNIDQSPFNSQNQFAQTRGPGPLPQSQFQNFQVQQNPQSAFQQDQFQQFGNGQQQRFGNQQQFAPTQFPPFLLNPEQPTVMPPERRGFASPTVVVANETNPQLTSPFFDQRPTGSAPVQPQPTFFTPQSQPQPTNFNPQSQAQQTVFNPQSQPQPTFFTPQSQPQPTFFSPVNTPSFGPPNPTGPQLVGPSQQPQFQQQFPVGFDQSARGNFQAAPVQVQFNNDQRPFQNQQGFPQ